jgi:hypothetical protein
MTSKPDAKSGLVHQGAGANTSRNTMTECCWNSHAQYSLHCHRMAAVAPVVEESTGTVPFTVIIGCGVEIVLAPERRLEASKLNAVRFFRVTLSFCDLIDHT